MPYIHFTEAQKLQANAVDLVEFLRFKGEPLVREGSEYRLGSNHSVTVRGSGWYDHAAERGEGPVTFLKEFYGMNYQEAVLTLLDGDVGKFCSQVTAPREKVKKSFELPPANQDNRRVFAYLLKHHHLDRDVLTTFVRAGLVYEDQKYHNAVFVGMDKDGTPAGLSAGHRYPLFLYPVLFQRRTNLTPLFWPHWWVTTANTYISAKSDQEGGWKVEIRT